jgi:hypothetical protein
MRTRLHSPVTELARRVGGSANPFPEEEAQKERRGAGVSQRRALTYGAMRSVLAVVRRCGCNVDAAGPTTMSEHARDHRRIGSTHRFVIS